MRLKQIVEPGRPGSFFERYRQSSAQSGKELQNGCGFRFQDGSHNYLSLGIHHRYRDRCLMNVQPIYFSLFIEVLLSWVVMRNDDNLLPKGRPLIMRFRQLSITRAGDGTFRCRLL
jgi:hypothetical protein